MKNENYKRLYIKEVYLAAVESTIDARLAEMVQNWANETWNLHPGLKYRIVNAETQMINASTWAGQSLPPTIRYVIHIAYTI